MAVWSPVQEAFQFWYESTDPSVEVVKTWVQPPSVPRGWSVYWSCEYEEFYFGFVGSFRGQEVDAVSWERPPFVPEPWMVLLDPDNRCLVFWNPVLGVTHGLDSGDVPSSSPPSVDPYFPMQMPTGAWVYIDSETGMVDPHFHPGRAPHGWVEDWCISHQSWMYKNLSTGEVTYEYPKLICTVMDASASLAALREAQLLPMDEELSPSTIRKAYQNFGLCYHPDKCVATAAFYVEYKAHFEELLSSMRQSESSDLQQADSSMVPSAPLQQTESSSLQQAESSPTPSVMLALTFDETCLPTIDAADSQAVSLSPAAASSRNYGYVPMRPGDFTRVDQALRVDGMLADAPDEYLEVLEHEPFWKGLSWHYIAQCVHVQLVYWADEGWAVSSRLRLGLQQRAMEKHETGEAPCSGSAELLEVLLPGSCLAKLSKVARHACSSCGSMEATRRRTRLPGSFGARDKRVFCPRCLVLATAEDSVQHSDAVEDWMAGMQWADESTDEAG